MKSKKFREKGLSFGAPQNQTEFSWHGRGFFEKIGNLSGAPDEELHGDEKPGRKVALQTRAPGTSERGGG